LLSFIAKLKREGKILFFSRYNVVFSLWLNSLFLPKQPHMHTAAVCLVFLVGSHAAQPLGPAPSWVSKEKLLLGKPSTWWALETAKPGAESATASHHLINLSLCYLSLLVSNDSINADRSKQKIIFFIHQ